LPKAIPQIQRFLISHTRIKDQQGRLIYFRQILKSPWPPPTSSQKIVKFLLLLISYMVEAALKFRNLQQDKVQTII